jgi:predicted enzyme related to lactoylglutathione lyase
MPSARVVHFEIPFEDGDRARAFYAKVFEWSVDEMPELDYTGVGTGPAGDDGMPSKPGYIGGGMAKREGTFLNPTIVMGVEDIDAMLKVIEANGGKTLSAKEPVGDMGFAAYFTDTEGNTMGLWQTA